MLINESIDNLVCDAACMREIRIQTTVIRCSWRQAESNGDHVCGF